MFVSIATSFIDQIPDDQFSTISASQQVSTAGFSDTTGTTIGTGVTIRTGTTNGARTIATAGTNVSARTNVIGIAGSVVAVVVLVLWQVS